MHCSMSQILWCPLFYFYRVFFTSVYTVKHTVLHCDISISHNTYIQYWGSIMKGSSLNKYLVLIAAIMFGIIIASLFIVGHELNPTPIPRATALSMLIGVFLCSIFSSLVIAYGSAIIVNIVFNIFRKEKQSFSYLWVWLFLIVSFFIIGHINNIYIANYKTWTREQFVSICATNTEKTLNIDTASTDQHQAIIDRSVKYCTNIRDVFFNTYDKCMITSGNATKCKWQASYQACMTAKNDDAACKDFADKNL